VEGGAGDVEGADGVALQEVVEDERLLFTH
jgi:hypothetical protein